MTLLKNNYLKHKSHQIIYKKKTLATAGGQDVGGLQAVIDKVRGLL
jgi:hypothetical protein